MEWRIDGLAAHVREVRIADIYTTGLQAIFDQLTPDEYIEVAMFLVRPSGSVSLISRYSTGVVCFMQPC